MRQEVLGNCCAAACVAKHVGRHRGVRGCSLTDAGDAGFQRLFVYLRLSTDSNPLAFLPPGCRCLEVASGHMEREMITTTDRRGWRCVTMPWVRKPSWCGSLSRGIGTSGLASFTGLIET